MLRDWTARLRTITDPYHRRGISYPTRYVEHRIFERHDEARERYQRGSREFEGRLPRSGGWERALADDRRGDRFRDLQRDRERTDRLDGDRPRRVSFNGTSALAGSTPPSPPSPPSPPARRSRRRHSARRGSVATSSSVQRLA